MITVPFPAWSPWSGCVVPVKRRVIADLGFERQAVAYLAFQAAFPSRVYCCVRIDEADRLFVVLRAFEADLPACDERGAERWAEGCIGVWLLSQREAAQAVAA